MTTKTKSKTKPSPKGTSGKQSSRKVPVLGIVFGLIALLLIAAIVASPKESLGTGGEYGEPTTSGDALPAMARGVSFDPDDPAVGEVAPDVTGTDFDGSAVEITHDGTPKAILFLAHWCPHCQAEVPRVQAWLDGGGGVEGVEIMSVTTSSNSGQANWPPSAWMEREGWTSPNIRDDADNSVLNAYGGSSFPYWVFLNGDGTVAARVSGEMDIATLQGFMETLVGG